MGESWDDDEKDSMGGYDDVRDESEFWKVSISLIDPSRAVVAEVLVIRVGKTIGVATASKFVGSAWSLVLRDALAFKEASSELT